jgi:hypothetical protein
MDTTLTLLLHGDSGVGKSWLADTAPAPRLILDGEGRAKYTPSQPKVLWEPRNGPPPAVDGTWNTCIAPVQDFETMALAYRYFRAGQHHFKSIVVDSLMEVQKRCIDSIAGLAALDPQGYGTLLRNIEKIVRDYRDLTMIPSNHCKVVVFVNGTRERDGKYGLLLQGQLSDTLAYLLDVVGYYFLNPVPDGKFVRSLLVNKQPGFVAKDGTGKLVANYGSVIPNPNIEEMVNLLHVNGKAETVVPNQQGGSE